MDPQQDAVAREFDGYRNSYEDAVNQAIGFSPFKVNFFVRAKADLLCDLADRHFGSRRDLAVLDVGCGIGQYQPLIAHRFGRLSGVDISSASIDRAKETNPGVDYRAYDGHRLPYGDGTFDIAFTACVVHHVPPQQWEAFVGELRRIVRPGGFAVIFEHNPRHPLTMKAVNDCPFDKDAVLVRPAKARELLTKAGFAHPTIRHILTIPPVGRLGRVIDRMLATAHFGTQYYALGTV